MNSIRLLVIMSALAGAVVTADAACVDHTQQPYLQYSDAGLYDAYPDLCTAGDYVYFFDGTHLDCLDVSDPLHWAKSNYQPGITLTPNPDVLVKVGQKHLYAFQPGYLSVIDISTKNAPTLVDTSTGPFTSTATLEWLMERDGYLYFLDDDDLVVIDARVPTSPVVASRTTFLYSGYDTKTLVYEDYIFVFFPGFGSQLAFVDISDPAAPVVTYPDVEQAPFVPDFNSYVVDVHLQQHYVHIKFTDNPGQWDQYYDVSDPLNWVTSYTWPGEVVMPNLAVEGDRVFWGISGGGGAGGQIHPVTDDPFYYGWSSPFAKPAIADNAFIFCSYWSSYPRVVFMERQCEYPQIIAGTPSLQRTYPTPGNEVWVITWETDQYTSPELDTVVLSDAATNPPQGQTGTVTLTGRGTVEELASGNWKHRVTYRYMNCTPKCGYYYTVASTRTSNTVTSAAKLLKVSVCAGAYMTASLDEGPTFVASPNPFNPSTEISFTVPAGTRSATLDIYDLAGRRVQRLYELDAETGRVTRTWQGRDESGQRVGSGVYFAVLEIDGRRVTEKLALLK